MLFPRQLPEDETTCSAETLKRIKLLRTPRGEVEKQEEMTATFDPMKYVKK